MKHNDSKNPRKKSFLHIPAYPGGKEAYLKFIKDNVIYPEQARIHKIEGFVYLVYTVINTGEIVDVEVSKGIGYGCDEEAMRVIRLLKYEPAHNRGIRMKVQMKTKLHFGYTEIVETNSQPDFKLNYTSPETEKANSPEPKPQAVYNYKINIG
jgi:TonB family protein